MATIKLIIMALFIVAAQSAAGDLITLTPAKNKFVHFTGDQFFVSCSTEGKNVQRVMWAGPENNPVTNYQDRIRVDAGMNNGIDLIVTDAQVKDRGVYTCSANVDGKEVQKDFELLVYKIADFKGTPKNQFLEEGKNSTIKCNVEGDPKPRVSWRKDNDKIKLDGGQYASDPDNKNWLVVQNASISDSGVYSCKTLQLNSKVSEMKTFDITVDVHHKPFGPKEHSVESFSFVSGVVNLTCEAVAQPKANFTWLKDGSPLNDSDTYQIFNEDHMSVLEINVEDESMFGDYYCKAENDLGTLERVVSLEKGRKPAIPHTEIEQDGSHKFELKINSQNHPEMPILSYKVEYKRPGEEWSSAKFREFKAGNSDKYVLSNLETDTLYVLRASARNVAGSSDPSPEKMKRTTKQITSGTQALSGSIDIVSIMCLYVITNLYLRVSHPHTSV